MVTPNARLIAIVEDDQTTAGTYQHLLEEEGGWRTLVLGDGEEALHRLPEVRPDVILLDMTLPGLDGASLYRLLRARPETARTPILIVTAAQDWKLRRVGLEPRAYLRKPFNVADLLSAIEALLGDRPESPPPAAE